MRPTRPGYLDLRRARRRDDDFRFGGTFAPARRAFESPIAIACLRLFTRFFDRPDLSVPRLRSRIASRTFAEAFFPYRAMSAPYQPWHGTTITVQRYRAPIIAVTTSRRMKVSIPAASAFTTVRPTVQHSSGASSSCDTIGKLTMK